MDKKDNNLRMAALNRLIDKITDLKFTKYSEDDPMKGIADILGLLSTEFVSSFAAYLLMFPKEDRQKIFMDIQKSLVDQIFSSIEKFEPMRDDLFKKIDKERG